MLHPPATFGVTLHTAINAPISTASAGDRWTVRKVDVRQVLFHVPSCPHLVTAAAARAYRAHRDLA